MKRKPTSRRFVRHKTKNSNVRAVKSVASSVTIQGLSPARWVQEVLETPEGNRLVEEMKRKYHLAI